MRGIIQVAGVIDAAEARLLVDCGVTHLGFPLRLPVHAEDLSDGEAATIIASLPESTTAVLITYLHDAHEIDALCRKLGVTWVQLHGEIEVPELVALRQLRRELVIIKSLVIDPNASSDHRVQLERYEPHVDAFITDTFDQITGASGATGKLHDWAIDEGLVRQTHRPVIIAGGLRPENVHQAISTIRPAGVDVHTGVEGANGRKDAAQVAAFVHEARRAFADVAREELH